MAENKNPSSSPEQEQPPIVDLTAEGNKAETEAITPEEQLEQGIDAVEGGALDRQKKTTEQLSNLTSSFEGAEKALKTQMELSGDMENAPPFREELGSLKEEIRLLKERVTYLEKVRTGEVQEKPSYVEYGQLENGGPDLEKNTGLARDVHYSIKGTDKINGLKVECTDPNSKPNPTFKCVEGNQSVPKGAEITFHSEGDKKSLHYKGDEGGEGVEGNLSLEEMQIEGPELEDNAPLEVDILHKIGVENPNSQMQEQIAKYREERSKGDALKEAFSEVGKDVKKLGRSLVELFKAIIEWLKETGKKIINELFNVYNNLKKEYGEEEEPKNEQNETLEEKDEIDFDKMPKGQETVIRNGSVSTKFIVQGKSNMNGKDIYRLTAESQSDGNPIGSVGETKEVYIEKDEFENSQKKKEGSTLSLEDSFVLHDLKSNKKYDMEVGKEKGSILLPANGELTFENAAARNTEAEQTSEQTFPNTETSDTGQEDSSQNNNSSKGNQRQKTSNVVPFPQGKNQANHIKDGDSSQQARAA